MGKSTADFALAEEVEEQLAEGRAVVGVDTCGVEGYRAEHVAGVDERCHADYILHKFAYLV